MTYVEKWLEQSFALTGAERRLAIALLKGERLKQFAETRQISVNTSRVQLASIFAKTGVKRQADLILLIMAANADGSQESFAR
jgi:DNA-binding CsgD family transcriptional regulator